MQLKKEMKEDKTDKKKINKLNLKLPPIPTENVITPATMDVLQLISDFIEVRKKKPKKKKKSK